MSLKYCPQTYKSACYQRRLPLSLHLWSSKSEDLTCKVVLVLRPERISDCYLSVAEWSISVFSSSPICTVSAALILICSAEDTSPSIRETILSLTLFDSQPLFHTICIAIASCLCPLLSIYLPAVKISPHLVFKVTSIFVLDPVLFSYFFLPFCYPHAFLSLSSSSPHV